SARGYRCEKSMHETRVSLSFLESRVMGRRCAKTVGNGAQGRSQALARSAHRLSELGRIPGLVTRVLVRRLIGYRVGEFTPYRLRHRAGTLRVCRPVFGSARV